MLQLGTFCVLSEFFFLRLNQYNPIVVIHVLAWAHCKGQFRVISLSLDLLTGHLISSFGAFRSTHWQQTVVYIDEPISVEQDTVVAGTIQLTPCERRNPYVRPKWRQFIASHLNLVFFNSNISGTNCLLLFVVSRKRCYCQYLIFITGKLCNCALARSRRQRR